MRRKFLFLIFCLLTFLFTSCKSNQVTFQSEFDSITLNGPYIVERVIDGDTIICCINNESVRIRLIGIDTPECVSPDDDKNSKEGQIASEYLKEVLSDKYVYLEYDEELIDSYNRTLAYVYLSDEMKMIQYIMLEQGYAKAIRIEPNTKYYDEFIYLQNQAKNNDIGFWKTSYFN